MLKRIVKMCFRAGEEDRFLTIFEQSKNRIRTFDGCQSLELLRDHRDPRVFFTISVWTSMDALEAYRH